MSTDLRLGRWQDVLADVECDALICDPPYGAKVHSGHNHLLRPQNSGLRDGADRQQLSYSHWEPDHAREFARHWSDRTRGWIAIQSCHTLQPHYAAELESAGRYVFPPIPLVIRGMTCRMAGDGPSSWTVWLTVARPKTKTMAMWGTLPGSYVTNRGAEHIGGKPLKLMQAIVRDYSRPGDLVCDPCAGYATTGVACQSLGRRFIGAEIDPETYAKGQERLSGSVQLDLLGGTQ